MPRLADVYHRLPVQENLLQLEERKSEKCIFYPRIEAGRRPFARKLAWAYPLPGVLLYDADAIESAASTEKRKRSAPASTGRKFLDPNDPAVIEQRRTACRRA
ncbi:hypothetical protein KCP77_13525 [Salmonella enterica subsp. enterica]|nr:hypothetical protein KCP77_13525 [Salmonella enterica subsp. enterica]